MSYHRQIIHGFQIDGVVDLPEELRNKRVEVIILPVDDATTEAPRKRQIGFVKLPPIPDSFFEPLPEEELQVWE